MVIKKKRFYIKKQLSSVKKDDLKNSSNTNMLPFVFWVNESRKL